MSNEMIKFYDLIVNFCQWIEGGEHDLLQAKKYLLELMIYIPEMEGFRGIVESDEEHERRGYEGWKEDRKKLSDLPFQYYQEMFDPHDLDQKEPVTGDLNDDFADIYGDLKLGLGVYEKGYPREAVGMMVDSYFYHWGEHAASALRVIDSFYRANQGWGLADEPEETDCLK